MSRMQRALALASALSLLPALALAGDPYADFRVPDHRTFSWILSSDGGIDSRQPGGVGELRERDVDGHLLSRMVWASETEARQRDLAFATDARWSSDRRRFDALELPAAFEHELTRFRNDHQLAAWSGDQRSYLGGSSFALEAQASAELEVAQLGRVESRHDFNAFPGSPT